MKYCDRCKTETAQADQTIFSFIVDDESGTEIYLPEGVRVFIWHCLTCGWTQEIAIGDESQNSELSAAASVLGKRGGASKSKAKQAASRENGKLGGRPVKKQA